MRPSDPGALISRSPVTLTVAGVKVTVPFAPAAAWLDALQDPARAVLHLADKPSKERLMWALLDVPGAEDAIRAQSYDLIRRATGRSQWWESTRLANTAASPDVLGRLVLAGVDPHTRSIGEWCAAMYTVATQNADQTQQIKFDMTLAFPPPGYEDEWDDDEDYESMAAGFRDLPGQG